MFKPQNDILRQLQIPYLVPSLCIMHIKSFDRLAVCTSHADLFHMNGQIVGLHLF